ncbi:hypothetical protein [Singulisphaera acidiphila]|uniref:hypothetical protein n=1 Tax=Singulisphaera acidiphila TaxID=466153 RepID=UPI0012B5A3B3|nr:hypothetical protein [Singulisphaera acidiphila]
MPAVPCKPPKDKLGRRAMAIVLGIAGLGLDGLSEGAGSQVAPPFAPRREAEREQILRRRIAAHRFRDLFGFQTR